MANDIRTVRFNPPVYKNKDTDPGVLAKAGDVLTVLLKGNAADGTHPQQPLTILTANESGTQFEYEFSAANQYVLPNRIVGVIPIHTWECPAADNIGVTDASLTTVTSFSVNGVVHTETYPSTVEGAADLQLDLNTALQGNGAATVQWNGTSFIVHIMNTTAKVQINGVDVVALP